MYDIVVKDVCVGQYNNKGSFGELALMYNTPRAATIVATEEGALWGLVRSAFMYTDRFTIYYDAYSVVLKVYTQYGEQGV